MDTRWLQHALNEIGYPLVVDGVYGVKTVRAVTQFRVDHFLPPWAALDELIETYYEIDLVAPPPPELTYEEFAEHHRQLLALEARLLADA